MDAERIRIAVQFLKDGESFKVENLRLGIIDKSTMYVTGWSQFSNIDNLTKSQLIDELDQIKHTFKKMLDLSSSLKIFIEDKSIKYNLALDYGMGAVPICSEKDGIIEWAYEKFK